MNRLQKKCVIATAGTHLLLLLILVVGPAFYNPKPKADNTQVLDVIPSNLIDAALSSGMRNATPAPAPAPAPQTAPPTPALPLPPPMPPPPPPKPAVTEPSFTERIEKMFRTEPAKTEPTPTPAEHRTHTIQVNTQLVSRAASEQTSQANPQRNTRAINSAIKDLEKNLSPGTVVNMPGGSSVSYASYKDALATIYYNAWVAPEGVVNDLSDTYVKITVESDGTVASSRIITPSGDDKMDSSVQRALNRVSSVPPLPAGSKSEEDFTIDFNLKTKRTLE